MTPETLLETLRLHGRSSVCLVEPRDARAWAEVVAGLLAVQRYTPTPSPTPALLEHVDSTLDLAARVVELEVKLAELEREANNLQEERDDLNLTVTVLRRELAKERTTADQSVTGEVLVANLGRCGFCGLEKDAAELINGECASASSCVARAERLIR